MKKMISVPVSDIRDLLQGDIDEVITKLQSFQKPGVKRSIDISLGYDDCIDVTLEEKRLETDKEEEDREKREAEQAVTSAAWELLQYQRLRAKFEGGK